MANQIGNFTLLESKADCGGGNCDPSPTYNMTSFFGDFLMLSNESRSRLSWAEPDLIRGLD